MFTYVETKADEVYYKGIFIRMDLSRVIPTNSILPLKASAFVNFFISFLLVLFITSCSSTSSQTKKINKIPVIQMIENSDVSIKAEDYVSKAKSANNSDSIKLLIKASQVYLTEDNNEKSLWLAKKVMPLAYSGIQRYHLNLVKAESLYKLDRYDLSYQSLQLANNIVLDKNDVYEHSAHYYFQLWKTQQALEFPIQALSAQMQYFTLNELATPNDIQDIWFALNTLTPWQLDLLLQSQPPFYDGWQQLLNISHKFSHDVSRFNRSLIQWQRKYPSHPANSIIAELETNFEHPTLQAEQSFEKIAILLPLSGKQKIAGQVLQEGILAAYEQHQEKSLYFIDTNTFDMTNISQEINQKNIDYIIGPLLKSNVMAYLAIPDITTPTLLLNVPDNYVLAPHQSALSMRPEDEAVQAAVTLSQYKFKSPLLLCHDDAVSLRIANTFISSWRKNTGIAPELSLFQDKTQMQAQLKASLDLTQSMQRYKDLRWRVKEKLSYEYRNRRDVDMIYIIGSPTETKLLKPYIDVNVSPFAKLIPVFASSRSHSMRLDDNGNRDLNGLTFTEMPWFLKSPQQNTTLAKLSKNLWPDRSDNLQRFFAIGYDSLNLADKLPQMKKSNYLRHYGQIGLLQLNSEHIITRSLLWGKYIKDKAQTIELD